ncbi:MAG: hypothetical protein ACI88C_001268 [Acidimicrobiales bacterium]|jgi:hypothetical protein
MSCSFASASPVTAVGAVGVLNDHLRLVAQIDAVASAGEACNGEYKREDRHDAEHAIDPKAQACSRNGSDNEFIGSSAVTHSVSEFWSDLALGRVAQENLCVQEAAYKFRRVRVLGPRRTPLTRLDICESIHKVLPGATFPANYQRIFWSIYVNDPIHGQYCCLMQLHTVRTFGLWLTSLEQLGALETRPPCSTPDCYPVHDQTIKTIDLISKPRRK